MKAFFYAVSALACFMLYACSLAPRVPITKRQLYDTSIYNKYVIKESPDSVLAAINREGEVVLEAKYKEFPIYLKILATSKGLQVSVMER